MNTTVPIDLDRLADAVVASLAARAALAVQRDRLLAELDDDALTAASVKGQHVPGTSYEWSHGWIRAGMHEPTDEDHARLKEAGIKIPPGWTEVQVANDPKADLQVLGKDAKGRRQSVYSAEHAARQSAAKFARIRAMHDKVPAIDEALTRDAGSSDDAAALMLIRRMGLRPGSDADTGAEKKAHGATNLKAGHVTVTESVVRLTFTGKKGVDLDLEIDDPELAEVLGSRLARKNSDDRLLDTNERKTANYLKGIEGAEGVKLKDLRTYRGTTLARSLVEQAPAPTNRKTYTAATNQVADVVSRALGNTRAVALESYIDPDVFSPWRSVADLR